MGCELCKRDIDLTKHHLIPKSKDGDSDDSNYMYLCKDCHSQIHLLYTNAYLRDFLNTKELVLGDEKLIKFAKFAKKQTKRISKKQSKYKYK